jgi:opacity protein-like surface antigen
MRSHCAPLFTLLAVLVAAPAHAADEQQPSDRFPRFSVHVGVGSHLNDGGNHLSVSFGYNPWRTITLLVNVERSHIPTRVRTYVDGYSATRNGTQTLISGEFRYTLPFSQRLSPFLMVGRGAGPSRVNVNEYFPIPRETRTADSFYLGGGVRIPFAAHFEAFADGRLLLGAERGRDSMFGRAPIRGGVAWRF